MSYNNVRSLVVDCTSCCPWADLQACLLPDPRPPLLWQEKPARPAPPLLTCTSFSARADARNETTTPLPTGSLAPAAAPLLPA